MGESGMVTWARSRGADPRSAGPDGFLSVDGPSSAHRCPEVQYGDAAHRSLARPEGPAAHDADCQTATVAAER
jgi:hypothetical protein